MITKISLRVKGLKERKKELTMGKKISKCKSPTGRRRMVC